MDDNVLRQLASQQYHFHLLVKILNERGVLKPRELEDRYSEREFSDFLRDSLESLRKARLRLLNPRPLPVLAPLYPLFTRSR